MSLSLDDVTRLLRDQILLGRYRPGERLKEVEVAQSLGVSRTLSRLAMGTLEHAGLLDREPNRGSRVRSFSIEEIAQAIEVRGELEAMAARLAAERGLEAEAEAEFGAILAQGDALLAGGVATDPERDAWSRANLAFHQCLVRACGNRALGVAIAQMSNFPLASADAIIFERRDLELSKRQLANAHREHQLIVEAIIQRQGHRAEALVREHTYSNARNKRLNLRDPEVMARARMFPGGMLIRNGPETGKA